MIRMPARAALRGLVIHDDPVVVRAVAVIMGQCGVEPVAHVNSGAAGLPIARAERPQFVVLDLALSGVRGVHLVSDLQAAAPGCTVVVLSPYTGLHEPARQAGARDLLDPSDLRVLRRCLQDAVSGADGHAGCSCGWEPTPGTAPAFDPTTSRVSEPRVGSGREPPTEQPPTAPPR